VIAGRYRTRVEGRYGPLRPVVVSSADLPAGQAITPAEASEALMVRRVPGSFIPPGALRRPRDALGRAPGSAIPAGSYVLDAQLVVPQVGPPPAPEVGRDKRPVEVPVSGAEALTVGGASPEGSQVDVVVSQQSGLGNKARTYIAAEGVRLLALQSPGGPGEEWSATLALTRDQALDLISAESAARQIRLLPRP
jgi:Flp pilus assembly protein CpaB